MKLKQFFIEYFNMNRMQQSGTIVLIFLIIVVSLLPRFVARYNANRSQPDFARFDSLMANYEPLPVATSEPVTHARNIDTVFTFDPNTATYDDFLCMGLSEKISANIVKYRKSGGKFRTPDDFARIYGINDSIYSRLKPYISIAAKAPSESQRQTAKKEIFRRQKKGKDRQIRLRAQGTTYSGTQFSRFSAARRFAGHRRCARAPYYRLSRDVGRIPFC